MSFEQQYLNIFVNDGGNITIAAGTAKNMQEMDIDFVSINLESMDKLIDALVDIRDDLEGPTDEMG